MSEEKDVLQEECGTEECCEECNPETQQDAQMILPEGVTAIDLSDKDMSMIGALTDLDNGINAASGQIIKALAKVLTDVARMEGAKAQLTADLQKKYEIPEGAQWQAHVESKKLFWKMPEPQGE